MPKSKEPFVMNNMPCSDCGEPAHVMIYDTGPEAWCSGCGKKYMCLTRQTGPGRAQVQLVEASEA